MSADRFRVVVSGPVVATLVLASFVGLLSLVSTSTSSAAEPRRSGADDYGIAQVRTINEHLRQGWKDWGLSPSAPATEGEWCRRVYLDILGRIPTVDELQEFVRDSDSRKKLNLVNKLLEGDKYTEDYARNWTTIWTNILIGRSGGQDQNSLTSREGMQKYLRDSFARSKPYDRLAYELITATGATEPGRENFNGAVNFLVDKVNEENATLATAQTAKIFLGMQVQCTQCHNHPFNEWKQQKFWEFNAFFRQTRALRRFDAGARNVAFAELVNEDFAGESGRVQEADIYFEQRNGILSVAYPVFIDGTEIPRSGYADEVNRREELGKLILQSEWFDKAIVNRTWAHFLGYGFTKPIDDLGPHNPSSHPELLDYLGQEFRKRSYDLKQLIRWITLSEAYGLSSRMNGSNRTDDPLLGEQPKFSHFYLRQMRAEEMYESLLVATNAHQTRGSYEEQERIKADWLSQFVVAFGNDEGEESTTFNGTIPQALMMFNGDLIRQATSAERGSFLWNLQASNSSPKDKIEYLYQAALARKPTKDELAMANKLLVARNGEMLAALQDIWWALLNSNEFILNH